MKHSQEQRSLEILGACWNQLVSLYAQLCEDA